jgi:molecular chaperone GrpE
VKNKDNPEVIEEINIEETPEPVDWQTAAEEKEKACAELFDRLQRVMAEFDNYRKRTIKEKTQIYSDAVKDTLEQLLPVVDNFERGLAVSEGSDNAFCQGIQMTFRQLTDILAKLGVEALPGVGEPFDPNLHHAVAHITDENLDNNVIIEELQRGYKYKDKVLRPSMVKVAN